MSDINTDTAQNESNTRKLIDIYAAAAAAKSAIEQINFIGFKLIV